jgi:hypothetical protein
VFLCVPSVAGEAVVSGGSEGSCESDATKVAVPASAHEQQTLLSILPHISFVSGHKRTIRFHGVNVQVVNGTGDTRTADGLGNLIIGYDGHSHTETQTGSHNLVLGHAQSFTSYGGLIGGDQNKVTRPFSAVFGTENTVSGDNSVVSGGDHNTASGRLSAVSGGDHNTASGVVSAVNGGAVNTASGDGSAVSGGLRNTASFNQSAVLGGYGNTASGGLSAVSGGRFNTASAGFSAVSGGRSNTASGLDASVFGCVGVAVSTDFRSNPSLCP